MSVEKDPGGQGQQDAQSEFGGEAEEYVNLVEWLELKAWQQQVQANGERLAEKESDEPQLKEEE